MKIQLTCPHKEKCNPDIDLDLSECQEQFFNHGKGISVMDLIYATAMEEKDSERRESFNAITRCLTKTRLAEDAYIESQPEEVKTALKVMRNTGTL